MNTAPRLARAITVHQTWWEDYTTWDGHGLYLDLDTAKAHAAHAYEGDEYGHPDPDDEDGEGANVRPDFTWGFDYGQWMLLDHGKDTLVRVTEATVYRPATPREIEQQDALRAAEKAARAMGPHMPMAMALEHAAGTRTTPA